MPKGLNMFGAVLFARSRRAILGCLALAAAAAPGFAQNYPNKPIHMYNGYPPGTSPDIVSRHFANHLKTLGGQPVVVENKVGAGSMIALEAVARAKPDGYTISFGPGASAQSVQQKALPFNSERDLVPIAAVLAFPFYLLVDPARTPAKSVDELVAILKKRDKVSYGAPNTLSHVGGALLSNMRDLNAVAVQYKSTADTIRDMNAGLLDFAFVDAGLALAKMKSGELRGLAVSMSRRAKNAPDIPTMKELGFDGFDFQGWLAIQAPAGIPDEVKEKLEKWVLEIARSEETAAFYKGIGAEVYVLNAKEFLEFERREFVAWRERAKAADIRPE